MNTSTIEVGEAWVKIAEDTDNVFLTFRHNVLSSIAFQETDVAPTEDTHHVIDAINQKAQGFTRVDNIPPGFVYVKTLDETCDVCVTTW